MGAIHTVSLAARPRFEAFMRGQVGFNVSIRDLVGNDTVPSPERPVYYPLTYIKALAPSTGRAFVGVDFVSMA
jgi:hypothetical protein